MSDGEGGMQYDLTHVWDANDPNKQTKTHRDVVSGCQRRLEGG